MEAKVVVLVVLVSAGKHRKEGFRVLHIDDLLLGALFEEREKSSSHPVYAEDVDGEAFCEVVPEVRQRIDKLTSLGEEKATLIGLL